MRTAKLPAPHPPVAYDDRGHGPAVVLLHAFPMCRWMWKPQADALEPDFRVLTPDLPGFGSTAVVPNVTIDGMADLVAAFLPAAGVTEPVVLGGLSMGGYVALAFARRHPQLLRGLVLADTRAEPDDDAGKRNRDKQLIALAAGKLTPTTLIEDMLPKMLADPAGPAAAEVKRIGSAQPVAGITAAVAALRDRPDALPGLGNIRVPTVILVGENDAITPPDAATKLAAGIPGSAVVRIPAAGHLSNLENPAAFNAALRSFLDTL